MSPIAVNHPDSFAHFLRAADFDLARTREVALVGADTDALAAVVRASVEYAWAHPDASAGYVAEHAAEMSPDVQAQHIALYVNDFTRDLGDDGYAAVRVLLTRAYDAGLTPSNPELR